jgi:two-component system, OmpR family, response regulator
MSRLLVVEDNERIAEFVGRGLRSAGYDVDVVGDGRAALAAARGAAPDMIVLDLGLPDIDGLEVLATLRADGLAMPVLVLTARGEVPDKVLGFERGADDYLTKPFAFPELLMRVRARLRRPARQEPGDDARELRHGDLRLDLLARRTVTPEMGERELSSREFALLETLMRAPERVFSREELLCDVWGLDFDPGSNVVEVYIRYLRRKIGNDRIRTVRGGGYGMASPGARS